MGRELVGVKVVGDIHEYLINGVNHDVFRRDIFQVDIVNPGAVLHVVSHARRGDNEINRKVRIIQQLGMKVGGPFQPMPRRVMLPSGIGFPYSLLDLKQTATA